MMSVWIPLATAGIGFLGGWLVALLSALLSRQSDRQAWLREQRIQVYAAYLSNAMRLFNEVHELRRNGNVPPDTSIFADHFPDATQRLYLDTLAAYHKLNILGSAGVIEAGNGLFQLLDAVTRGAELDLSFLRSTERKLYVAVKAELGLPAVAFDKLSKVHTYEP